MEHADTASKAMTAPASGQRRRPLPTNPFESSDAWAAKSLLTLRIIWFALLLGPLAFLAVVILQVLRNIPSAQTPQPVLIWVNAAMLLTELPVMFLIRKWMFDRARNAYGIPRKAYSTGNIIFWAGCEAVAYFGIIVIILNRSVLPTLYFAGIAIAMIVLTFPRAGILSSQCEKALQ
jgi:hypothetical protein